MSRLKSTELPCNEKSSKPFKARKIINTIFIILLTLFIFIVVWNCTAKPDEPEKTAIEFISYVIKGSDSAREMALGSVKYNLTRSPNLEFEVVNIKAETLYKGKNYCVVMATAQSQKDDIYNLGWYKLHMLKDGDQWKVYRIQETEPIIKDGKIEGVEEALAVLEKFIEALADYDKAATYLAGKARVSHLQMEEVFKNQLKKIKFNNISAVPISGNKETLLLKINYQVEDRTLNALVSFYKTDKGWMIYDISQI